MTTALLQSIPGGISVVSISLSFMRLTARIVAPCSWTPEESQVESCEQQDNADINYQTFPESISEEHQIYTDYDLNPA